MAANAPYYQMRSGQFVGTPRSTNATPSPSIPEDIEYATTDIPSPHGLSTASFSEHTVRQTPRDTAVNTSEENHNLVELLEAATTAAGQAVQTMKDHDAAEATIAVHGTRGRKRVSMTLPNDTDDLRSDAASDEKRRRVDMPMDPELQSTELESCDNSRSARVLPAGDPSLSDARAAGVHSAAALFRRTTENTTPRKYTRPPMSKLFISLQLSPENFLQLQAQAKMYMLDSRYPERQNCVGNRGKGDTDMVKLRLFNCVRDFLNDGAGEEFFGENVEGPGENDAMEAARALGENLETTTEKRFIWPKDGNKLISLVTPLMRRMVTNERQRMYAIETRKGGSKKKEKEDSAEAVARHDNHSPSSPSNREDSAEHHFSRSLDPSLRQVSQDRQQASPLAATSMTSFTPGQAPVANMTRLDKTAGSKPFPATDLPLPTHGLSTSGLTNLNIFLVIPPQSVFSGDTKAGIKLGEKRIFSERPDHLINFTWDSLLWEVYQLLIAAKARYSNVCNRVVAQNQGPNGMSAVTALPNNLTDNLRELAAAANAIQSDNITGNAETAVNEPTSTGMVSDPSVLPPSQDSLAASQPPSNPEPTLLPRYVIKTVGPSGWEYIKDAGQWKDLLSRRSVDIWADGVVNMIVDLVDVPTGQEQVTEGGEAYVGQQGEDIVKDGSQPADRMSEDV